MTDKVGGEGEGEGEGGGEGKATDKELTELIKAQSARIKELEAESAGFKELQSEVTKLQETMATNKSLSELVAELKNMSVASAGGGEEKVDPLQAAAEAHDMKAYRKLRTTEE